MSEASLLLSVVVPMYNEEHNAPKLIRAIDEALKGYPYELILVDDNSTDGTRQAIRDAGDGHVVLIELKKNYGQSSALMAGIDYAQGDFIITLDGDLQNDPQDIPQMIDKLIEADVDVVVGWRKNRQDNLLRTLPSKIANYIIRKTTKLNIKDHGCALKVFRRDAAKSLDLYGESHRFITLLTYIQGSRIAQIPVNHLPRIHGVSKYGIGRTFKVVNDLLLLLFIQKHLQKPIYLFGNLGMIAFLLGSCINVYLLILKLMGNEIGGRPLLILGVLLIFIGIQLFTSGIFIDLQMKTYYESQGKRPFNIRKITVLPSA